MGYNYNDIKNELIEKGLADDELVGLGSKPTNGTENLGSLILGVKKGFAGRDHAVTKQGDKIVIYPYTAKGVCYNEALTLEKSDIVKVSIYNFMGFFEVRFKTTIKGYKKLWLPITIGKEDVKKMLVDLGLRKKKA